MAYFGGSVCGGVTAKTQHEKKVKNLRSLQSNEEFWLNKHAHKPGPHLSNILYKLLLLSVKGENYNVGNCRVSHTTITYFTKSKFSFQITTGMYPAQLALINI